MKSFKKVLALVLVLVMALSVISCSPKKEEPKKEATETKNVIVKGVNGKDITQAEFQKNYLLIMENFINYYGIENNTALNEFLSKEINSKTYDDLLRHDIIEGMISEQLTMKYLNDKGVKIEQADVDKKFEEFKKAVTDSQSQTLEFFKLNGVDDEFIKEKIKYQMYDTKLQESVIAEVNAEVEKNPAELDKEIVQVKARHILVATEDEANKIIEKIKAGEKFEDLAKALTTDKASAEQGGDLGYFGKGQMIPEFEEVAFSANVGEISKPVKSMFGYHIIKVEDKKTYEQLKLCGSDDQQVELIRQNQMGTLYQKKYTEIVEGLKKTVTATPNEEMLAVKIEVKYPEVKKDDGPAPASTTPVVPAEQKKEDKKN